MGWGTETPSLLTKTQQLIRLYYRALQITVLCAESLVLVDQVFSLSESSLSYKIVIYKFPKLKGTVSVISSKLLHQ